MRSSNWLLVIDMSKDGSRKANDTQKNIGQHGESQLSLGPGGENEAFGSVEESELGEGGNWQWNGDAVCRHHPHDTHVTPT